MTLKEIIEIADRAYSDADDNSAGDGFVEAYVTDPDGEHGDTLAEFVARELKDVYDGSINDQYNLIEAARAMFAGAGQLHAVGYRLLREAGHLVVDDAVPSGQPTPAADGIVANTPRRPPISSAALAGIDWDLLHYQKQALCDVRQTICGHRRYSRAIGALDGILNMLDALQDEAEVDGRWKHPSEKRRKDVGERQTRKPGR